MTKTFIDVYDWNIPTYVDTMDNNFNETYCAWPDRAYIINDAKLIYYSEVNANGSRNDYWTTEIKKIILGNE
jgi:hypothetical protein